MSLMVESQAVLLLLLLLLLLTCATPSKSMCRSKAERHSSGCVQIASPLSALSKRKYMTEVLDDVPTSIDWRERGAVNGIKDQGNCDSCWAFSTVAAVEGIVQIKTGKLLQLSVQELVDCDKNNYGCRPGHLDRAFQYVIENNGLASEDSYPYTTKVGTCLNSGLEHDGKIHDYARVPSSEQHLLEAVTKQPVSAGVALQASFNGYKGGIFKGPCVVKSPLSSNEWHAITVIGYGTSQDGTKYWLIKNSWGEHWGENGYMRMKMEGGGSPWGLCGIAVIAYYPIVHSNLTCF